MSDAVFAISDKALVALIVGGITMFVVIIEQLFIIQRTREENASLKVATGPQAHKKKQAFARQDNFINQIFNTFDGRLEGLVVEKPQWAREGDLDIHLVRITDLKTFELVMEVRISIHGINLNTPFKGRGTGRGTSEVSQASVNGMKGVIGALAEEYIGHYSFNSNPHGT